MRARIHHRILLEEVQLTKRRGKQMTGRRAKSGPLLPLLSALAGDDIISRLRLVMTCPIFFGSNIPRDFRDRRLLVWRAGWLLPVPSREA